MRFGCLILLMFVVLACGREKKKETVNPLAFSFSSSKKTSLLPCISDQPVAAKL